MESNPWACVCTKPCVYWSGRFLIFPKAVVVSMLGFFFQSSDDAKGNGASADKVHDSEYLQSRLAQDVKALDDISSLSS